MCKRLWSSRLVLYSRQCLVIWSSNIQIIVSSWSTSITSCMTKPSRCSRPETSRINVLTCFRHWLRSLVTMLSQLFWPLLKTCWTQRQQTRKKKQNRAKTTSKLQMKMLCTSRRTQITSGRERTLGCFSSVSSSKTSKCFVFVILKQTLRSW